MISFLSITEGSNPRGAIKEALESWVRTTSLPYVLGEDSSVDSFNGSDGINLVTIADTPTNRNLFSGGTIGLSLKSFFATGRTVEADLVLDPGSVWTTLESDEGDSKNLFDVLLHELGHHTNLNHSVSLSSTMFASTAGFRFNFNPLSWDDITGANVSYPMVGLDEITGTITGKVTRSGNPVFGAFVIAVDDQGVLEANGITFPDGTYTMNFVAPGDYTLYVEPLDGPTLPGNVTGGVFGSGLDFVTDFLPMFFNESQTPSVNVGPGATTSGIDFEVNQGDSKINPGFVGAAPDLGFFEFSSAGGEANQGVNTNIGVAGSGVDDLMDDQGVFFLGDNLVAGSKVAEATETKVYELTVPLDTPQGEYPVFLQTNPELGVITGGLEVFAPFRFLQAFAQFANLPGTTSGVFLVNTDLNQSSSGKISARNGSGDRTAITLGGLSSDSNNDLDFTLGGGGALSLTSSGSSEFVGSLRVKADREVAGTGLFESQFGTTGVGASRPLYTFIAPIDFRDDPDPDKDVNTGFALANLDGRDAKVYIQAQDRSGNVQGSSVVDIQGNGHQANFISEYLPGTLPTIFEGSAVVTANRRIAATVISTGGQDVFTTFPVIQSRIFTRSFFAQFAHAGDLSSELLLVNPSDTQTANVTVTVRTSGGNPASVVLSGENLPQGTKQLSILPLGSISLQTQSDIVGSVEVETGDVPVGGVVLFSSPTVGTAGVGESFPETDFILPIARDTDIDIDTGIAMVNTTDQAVQVTLTVRMESGSQMGSDRIISLGARQQLANFPNEAPLNLGLPNQFTGSVWISAEAEIAATVIRLDSNAGVLTTFPVIVKQQFTSPSD